MVGKYCCLDFVYFCLFGRCFEGVKLCGVFVVFFFWGESLVLV